MSHLTWTVTSACHHVHYQTQIYQITWLPQENHGQLKCMKWDFFQVRNGQTHHEVLPLITGLMYGQAILKNFYSCSLDYSH